MPDSEKSDESSKHSFKNRFNRFKRGRRESMPQNAQLETPKIETEYTYPDPILLHADDNLHFRILEDKNHGDVSLRMGLEPFAKPGESYSFIDFNYFSNPVENAFESYLLVKLNGKIDMDGEKWKIFGFEMGSNEDVTKEYENYYFARNNLLSAALEKAKRVISDNNTPSEAIIGSIPLTNVDDVIQKRTNIIWWRGATPSFYPQKDAKDDAYKKHIKKYGVEKSNFNAPKVMLDDIDIELGIERPNDLDLEKVLGDCGDPTLVKYARMALNDNMTAEEKDRAFTELKKGLRKIMVNYLHANENGSERVKLSKSPYFQKESSSVFLNSNKDVPTVTKVGSVSGVTDRQLDKVLHIEGLSIQDILKSNTRMRPAQIAAKLLELFQSTGSPHILIDDEKPFNAAGAVEKYHEARKQLILKIIDDIADYAGSLVKDFPPDKIISKLQEMTDNSIDSEKINEIRKNLYAKYYNSLADSIKDDSGNFWMVEPQEDRLGVESGKFRSPRIEWRIAGNKTNTSGYYTTSTGAEFNFASAKWDTVNERTRAIQVSGEPVSKDVPHIKLDRRLVVNLFNNFVNLKIPVRDGTYLSAITLKDEEGNKMPYSVFEVQDGTIEFQIDTRLIDAPFVDMSAYLVDVGDSDIHATKNLKKSDVSKFTGTVGGLAEEIQDEQSFNDAVNKVISGMDSQYVYSLFEKPTMSRFFDNEAFISELGSLDGIQCSKAATIAAFILSTKTNGTDFVNPAMGFLHTGKLDFLLDTPKHAWLVSNEGKIYDPTPTRIANDGTQEWVSLWRDLEPAGKTPDIWDKVLNKLGKMASKLKKTKDERQIVRYADAPAEPEDLDKAVEDTDETLKISGINTNEVKNEDKKEYFSTSDLTNAYNFFTELSWSNHDIVSAHESGNEQDDIDLESVLDKMSHSVNFEKMELFLKNSNAEMFKDIPQEQKEKFKQIAYLAILQ